MQSDLRRRFGRKPLIPSMLSLIPAPHQIDHLSGSLRAPDRRKTTPSHISPGMVRPPFSFDNEPASTHIRSGFALRLRLVRAVSYAHKGECPLRVDSRQWTFAGKRRRFSWRTNCAFGNRPPYPSQTRALRKSRIHGESSGAPSGAHDICTLRCTRSGCGMRTLKRPSAVVSPVIPAGEPLGLSG